MVIKYWRGLDGSNKAGQCGTYDDENLPIDSKATTKALYDAWVSALPVSVVRKKIITVKDDVGNVFDLEVVNERQE